MQQVLLAYIQQLAACTRQLIYYDKHHVVNHEFHKNHQLYPLLQGENRKRRFVLDSDVIKLYTTASF